MLHLTESYKKTQVKNLFEDARKTCEKLKDENGPLYGAGCIDRLDEVKEFLEKVENSPTERQLSLCMYF